MKRQIKIQYNGILCKYSIFILMLIFLSCAASHHNHLKSDVDNSLILSDNIIEKIDMLQHDLISIGEYTDTAEARQLAETSIRYSLYLVKKYRLVRPPFLHNILVRMGIKDRGLCYHWTEDLTKRLAALDLKSFSLHQGVAYRGSELREHNTVVVTALGQEFNKGIVLDPWRNSGKLYWATVKTDKYPWEER